MTRAPTRFFALALALLAPVAARAQHQYSFGDIQVPAATAEEPRRKAFSIEHAERYLKHGAAAWSKQKKCVSCHTNGSYLLIRPALSEPLGAPSEEIRAFFVAELKKLETAGAAKLRGGIRPTQIAYLAAGLAHWDQHVTGKLSDETRRALQLMFAVQAGDGSFSNVDCWPPLESSSFHGATVAAMAAAAAPGWLDGLAKPTEGDSEVSADLTRRVDKLRGFLRDAEPAHDYARVLLRWTAARLPGLIDETRQGAIEKMIWSRQQADGGWSLREFATPETWGSGNRANKLRGEKEFGSPPSDGHMTGLAMVVLLESGADPADPRIRRGAAWLKANQRESGRWWTRSLNTDGSHYITYSGTCYPLLALAKCGELKPQRAGAK